MKQAMLVYPKHKCLKYQISIEDEECKSMGNACVDKQRLLAQRGFTKHCLSTQPFPIGSAWSSCEQKCKRGRKSPFIGTDDTY